MSKSVKVKRLPLCDFCSGENFSAARYDAKTKAGPWGYMCERHFKLHGVGLGTGFGQKLLLDIEES